MVIYVKLLNLHPKGSIFVSDCEKFLHRIKCNSCRIVRETMAKGLKLKVNIFSLKTSFNEKTS